MRITIGQAMIGGMEAMSRKPDGIIAVLDNGLRIPCEAVEDGRTPEGEAKFRIVAEGVNWREHQIVRVTIKHWPVDTALAVDIPGGTREQAQAYMARIKWIDLT